MTTPKVTVQPPMNLDAERNRLLALAEKAPPGPYTKHGPSISAPESENHREGRIALVFGNKYWRAKTTAFLAAAHDMAALIRAQAAEIERLRADAAAHKWGYEYLQDRMRSIGRDGWASDCDGEIEARIDDAIAAERKGDK